MKMSLSLLLLFGLTSCRATPAKETAPIPYAAFLETVKADKKALREKPLADARKYFFGLVNKQIPAYWGGTPWDFNGTTRTPGTGQIACGYFITNTLTDFGFPIERIKLAQAASSVLIKAVTVDITYPKDVPALKQYVLARADGSVYIVGLDFHTGYITREKNEVYFIHSNYINRKGVMKERVDESAALQASKTFMIGDMTANDAMLQKWLAN